MIANELIYKRNRLTDVENKLMVTKVDSSGGGGVGKEINQQFGINRYAHYYIENTKQQGPTVEHRKLYSISCNNL